MSRRQGATLTLVVGLALLGGSIAWAVSAARDGSFSGHHYAYGPAMMGLGYETGKASPLNGIAEARQRAQAFADRLGLKTDEVLRFERNYYVKLVDKQGANATEVLVDPATGATSLEYGPAMMWNTKYGMLSGRLGGGMMNTSAMRSMMGSYGASYGGMMGRNSTGGGMMGRNSTGGGMMGGATTGGGMMGGAYGTPALPSTAGTRTGLLTPAKAEAAARAWLLANEPGTGVKDAEAFPGYYTLETTRGGTIAGMISVNATTGAVWPHWWHGRFVG
jgi:hypothetical protein